MNTLKKLFRKNNVMLSVISMMFVVVIAACSGQNATTDSAATGGAPAEFRIGYQVIPNAEVLVKQQGLAEAKFPDVDIQWLPFESGRDVNTAMVSGGIDVGLAGSVPVATGIAQDLPYQVYFIHDVIGDSEALVVTEASGVKSMADLPGKTIGTPFGSTSHFSLLAALENEGIDAADVDIVDMQPQDMLAAWQRGDIDGGFVWHPILSQMKEDNATVLTSSRELAEAGIVTADIGIVSKDFAAQYPDFLAGYVEVLDEAVQMYRNDPEAAAAAMSEEIGLTPEESLVAMGDLIWLGIDEQASEKYLGTPENPGAMAQVLKDSAEFMVKQEAIESAPDLETYNKAVFNDAVAQ